jgi:hypothetical protein
MKAILKNQKDRIFSLGIVFVSIISVGIFAACSYEDYIDTVSFTQEEQNILSKNSVYGEQHNTYMKEIHENLYLMTNLKGGYKPLQDNVIDVVKSITINVIGDDLYSLNAEMKGIIDESFCIGKHVRLKNTSQENFIDSIINNSGVSSNFKKLYRELIVVSNNNNLTIEKQKSEIEKLEKTAFSILNEKELCYFLAGSSVSKASFEYWHTNMDKWLELFGINKKIRLKNGSENFWNDGGYYDGMTGADVGGMVGGIITGGIGGAALGGVGAGAGALFGGVAGSVGASTGKVVDNIGRNYGWW